MSSQSPVLNGIRVVDFGHYVAGPMAGMLLADHGADVIKVDPPGGPVFASPANAMWNRGKRSIALDLHKEADRAIARDLIRDADVVIENFRPGTMARWGLADRDVRKDNPGLVYLSLPGFAPGDPRSAFPAFEGTIYAAVDGFRPFIRYNELGVQSTTPPAERDGAPLANPDHIPSAYGAVLGCNCIVAALLARRRSGLGQAIELPLFEAMMQGVGVGAVSAVPPTPRVGPTFTPTEIQYECADGRWFVLICSIPAHGEILFRYLGREDFIERGLVGKTGFEILGMPDAYEEMYQYLTETFRTLTAREWLTIFHELGLPGSIINTTEEFLASDLVADNDILVEAEGEGGIVRQPNNPVILSRAAAFRPRAAVPVDHDRAAILAEIGRRPAREHGGIDPTQLVRQPLDEVKAVDLCVILAGPVAGRTLAEFGARVVKVDDPVRGANSFHDDVNRGKETVFLNLREADDLAQFWALVDEADVVAQNFRLNVLDKYGITGAEIRRRNPRAIWVATNAYGDRGPWAGLPGYEGSVQAATGLQSRYTSATAPGSWPYAVHDYLTGYLTGFGTMLALYARETTGVVLDVHAALLRTASLLQSEAWMTLLNPDAGSGDNAGAPFEGLFQSRDGWVHLAARNEHRVAQALGLSPGSDVRAAVREYTARHDCGAIVDLAHQHDLAAQELAWVRAIMAEPALQERGVSEIMHNHAGVPRWYVAPGPWMSLTPLTGRKIARKPGSSRPAFDANAPGGAVSTRHSAG